MGRKLENKLVPYSWRRTWIWGGDTLQEPSSDFSAGQETKGDLPTRQQACRAVPRGQQLFPSPQSPDPVNSSSSTPVANPSASPEALRA